MNIAVMQPYLFPYAGYFNLLAQVDKFVFFDDVNYINRGWINRNRLLLAGDVRYFTIPLIKASQNLKINQIYIQPKDIWLQKTLHTIKQSYAKAPNFHAVYDLLKEVFAGDSLTISDMARDSIKKRVVVWS